MDDEEFSSAELETVRWMMQKVLMRQDRCHVTTWLIKRGSFWTNLSQDMFLLGPPGSHLFCTALKTLTEA